MMSALAAAHAPASFIATSRARTSSWCPSPEGTRVVVTDFGVARGVEHDQFAAQVTIADAAVGTPAYMAPEQIEGGVLTAAIDQYALGVVLFEMVTGDLPFAGDTPLATAVKRLTQAPPSPEELVPGLDPAWVAVIRRCLARYPAERFPSVLDVDRALAQAETARRLPATGADDWPAPGCSGSTPAPRSEAPHADPAARRRVGAPGARPRAGRRAGAAIARVAARRVRRAPARGRCRAVSQPRPARRVRMAVGGARRDGRLRTARRRGLAHGGQRRRGARPGRSRAGGDRPTLGRGDLQSAVAAGHRLHRPRLLHRARQPATSASVRLAVRIEDAAKGETLGEAVETGGETGAVPAGLAGRRRDLRELLGSAARDAESATIASAPTNPRAARLYSEGLLKLRSFEPSAARELLEQAAAAEPGHPMIRAALAQAWAALGFEQRAEQEATRALEQGDRTAARGAPRRRGAGGGTAPRLAAGAGDLRSPVDGVSRQSRVRSQAHPLADRRRTRPMPPCSPSTRCAHFPNRTAATLASTSPKRQRPSRSPTSRVQRDAAARAGARAEALNAPLLVAEARLREAEALRRLGDSAGAATASEASRRALRRRRRPGRRGRRR